MPYFPARFLTPRRLAMLGSAQSIGIEDLEISKANECFKQNENMLNKILDLELSRMKPPKVKDSHLNKLVTCFGPQLYRLHRLTINLGFFST